MDAKICRWCEKYITYDLSVHMWMACVGGTFYCPKDNNEDRCQHIPKESE